MQIRVGYELIYDCPQPTPMVLMLNIHSHPRRDIVVPDCLITEPVGAHDALSRRLRQLVHAPRRARRPDPRCPPTRWCNDTGEPDPVVPSDASARRRGSARGVPVFLLGSRYCETDRLSESRGSCSATPTGGGASRRSATTCTATSPSATSMPASTRTAWEAFSERKGVCRDYAHLAIAFCRCMNIPARYCTGYLGDIGMPPPYGPMDFAAWFEAYLDGHWHTFDPRNNVPRIGRVLIARGRDATDVAISNTFGPNTLRDSRSGPTKCQDLASFSAPDKHVEASQFGDESVAVSRSDCGRSRQCCRLSGRPRHRCLIHFVDAAARLSQ